MKLGEFLIADDPMANDGRVFVVHTSEPMIVAEAFHFPTSQEGEWMRAKSEFSLGASVDYPGELIFLGARSCGPIPESWGANTVQEQADKLARVMSRMGDWYHGYLAFEDDAQDPS